MIVAGAAKPAPSQAGQPVRGFPGRPQAVRQHLRGQAIASESAQKSPATESKREKPRESDSAQEHPVLNPAEKGSSRAPQGDDPRARVEWLGAFCCSSLASGEPARPSFCIEARCCWRSRNQINQNSQMARAPATASLQQASSVRATGPSDKARASEARALLDADQAETNPSQHGLASASLRAASAASTESQSPPGAACKKEPLLEPSCKSPMREPLRERLREPTMREPLRELCESPRESPCKSPCESPCGSPLQERAPARAPLQEPHARAP